MFYLYIRPYSVKSPNHCTHIRIWQHHTGIKTLLDLSLIYERALGL